MEYPLFQHCEVIITFFKVVDFQFATPPTSSTVNTIYIDCRNKPTYRLLIPPSHFARYLTLQSVNYVIMWTLLNVNRFSQWMILMSFVQS